MNSKHPSIRIQGQRSISSTFLFRSSNRSSDCKDVQIKAPIRMLACPSPNSSTVGCTKALSYPNQFRCIPFFPGKERPFLSPVTTGDMKGAIKGEDCDKKSGEAEVNCVLDAAFEQLKHSNTEKEDSCIESVVGTSCTYEMRYARKRSNPFEGVEKQSAQKRLLVLGGDRNSKHEGKIRSFMSNEKPKPLFNHYANGSGWWDCNMEGVDNDEVGCNEVWEGVGSTTLGGLEWH
ncbi:hypothetical protein RJ639_025233 [Escallonia herrerae]|uniref:Uncharacterized protein n=1 Tax=Escallonia herrerae TaxID=1293975 RepID=A0AA88UY68_9ASTE|nr:hypothetical protein RJ639_025233 [Escallonia herrerae]